MSTHVLSFPTIVRDVDDDHDAPELDTIDCARLVVESQTAHFVDGVLLDMFTASAIVAVGDALKDQANRARFAAMDVERAGKIALQLCGKP